MAPAADAGIGCSPTGSGGGPPSIGSGHGERSQGGTRLPRVAGISTGWMCHGSLLTSRNVRSPKRAQFASIHAHDPDGTMSAATASRSPLPLPGKPSWLELPGRAWPFGSRR